MPQHRVIVVGGGLAGLAATVRIAEAGLPVDLFSMVPVKRSHSVCAQGGINACNEVARQQGYSEYMHFDETVYGGDFLADQPPIYEMTTWAPRIIDLLDRMGVPFNRTQEGHRDLRLFGGSLFRRTHFAGASTGQQLLYALDEQTRRHASDGKVTKYEFWEFLRPIVEDGRAVGIVAQDMRSMQIRSFRADAVVMATGGNGLIFGKSTNSVICTGGAASRCYQAGADYANAEFIQVHPTSIPGADKLRLMSESARGEGGRIWVPRQKQDPRPAAQIPDGERWYFLEEKYPKYGNLVPRDIATREIFQICMDGFGVAGQNQVYLDLTHRDEDYLNRKLGAILEIYEKFVGDDPRKVPMRIFPGVHYSMGGLYTTFTPKDGGKGLIHGHPVQMMTNIRGLYAFGEVNFAYHGGNRLGANALLSCIFDGLFCGLSVANYVRDCEPGANPAFGLDSAPFENAAEMEKTLQQHLLDTVGKGTDRSFNAYQIGREMGEEMTAASTVIKSGTRLEQCLAKLAELRERFGKVVLSDGAVWTNQSLSYTRAVGDMLILAEVIARSGLLRTESRGSHYRSDFTERDDANFMKTTRSAFQPGPGGGTHSLTLEAINASLVKPRLRSYGKADDKEADKKEREPQLKV